MTHQVQPYHQEHFWLQHSLLWQHPKKNHREINQNVNNKLKNKQTRKCKQDLTVIKGHKGQPSSVLTMASV